MATPPEAYLAIVPEHICGRYLSGSVTAVLAKRFILTPPGSGSLAAAELFYCVQRSRRLLLVRICRRKSSANVCNPSCGVYIIYIVGCEIPEDATGIIETRFLIFLHPQ